MLTVEELEGRSTPAVLDIDPLGQLTYEGGDGNNNLTVAVGAGVYSWNDSVDLIALAPGATAAGWKGDGTHSVSGPASAVEGITVSAGGGTNFVNLRSLQDQTVVNGDSGTTAVNLNSVAPLTIGNLAGIDAPVQINAGADTKLAVSDFGGLVRVGPVVIDGDSIDGLGEFPVTYAGTFASMTVQGSNVSTLAETFLITASVDTPSLRILTNGGNDTVVVAASNSGDLNTGNGDDVVLVVAGVTWTGSVNTGAGTDLVFAGPPAFGTITGVVI